VLILWGAVIERGFCGQSWLTFGRPLASAGMSGKARAARPSSMPTASRPQDERRRVEKTGEEPGTIPFLKRFTVFNTDQCERLPDDITTAAPPPPPGLIEPQAEALIAATARISASAGRGPSTARPTTSFRCAPPQAYFEPINWHRTAAMSYRIGVVTRLALAGSLRFLRLESYGREELLPRWRRVCLANLGIVPNVRHADYLGAGSIS